MSWRHKKLLSMLDETLVSASARDFVAVYDNYVYPWLQKDEDAKKYEEMWERLHELATEIPRVDRVHLDETINHPVGALWSHGQTWSW
jgi:hypothetical protein